VENVDAVERRISTKTFTRNLKRNQRRASIKATFVIKF
jgi:hypothetical protein